MLAKDHIAEQAKAAIGGTGANGGLAGDRLREMAKRSQQPNLSFFAFTATPKPKTLKFFGVPGADGKTLRPFHLLGAPSEIQEGFILNVLANSRRTRPTTN